MKTTTNTHDDHEEVPMATLGDDLLLGVFLTWVFVLGWLVFEAFAFLSVAR